jgi:hypothetical protein
VAKIDAGCPLTLSGWHIWGAQRMCKCGAKRPHLQYLGDTMLPRRERVLALIRQQEMYGATVDEIADALRLAPSTITEAIGEYTRQYEAPIMATASRRLDGAGHAQTVYIASEHGASIIRKKLR